MLELSWDYFLVIQENFDFQYAVRSRFFNRTIKDCSWLFQVGLHGFKYRANYPSFFYVSQFLKNIALWFVFEQAFSQHVCEQKNLLEQYLTVETQQIVKAGPQKPWYLLPQFWLQRSAQSQRMKKCVIQSWSHLPIFYTTIHRSDTETLSMSIFCGWSWESFMLTVTIGNSHYLVLLQKDYMSLPFGAVQLAVNSNY